MDIFSDSAFDRQPPVENSAKPRKNSHQSLKLLIAHPPYRSAHPPESINSTLENSLAIELITLNHSWVSIELQLG
jgi:hypothetical protein